MVICVRNYSENVKYVPLYEHVFRLADHMLPQDTETVSDKLLDDYNRFVFEGKVSRSEENALSPG